MSWIEIVGFITGAVCVILAVRRNIWNFPVGLANNAFFLVLFVDAGLYADAGLQIVYGLLGAVGWWSWLHAGADRTSLRVTRMPARYWPVALGAVGIGTALLAWLLANATDSTVPVADGLTTALSLVAQVMLNRKWLQNWAVWIAADILYVGLYAIKGLWLTSVLYAGFIALCLLGWRAWREHLEGSRARAQDHLMETTS